MNFYYFKQWRIPLGMEATYGAPKGENNEKMDDGFGNSVWLNAG